ncbi:MAG: LamG domain-containing protein [Planctomycetota bacterium]
MDAGVIECNEFVHGSMIEGQPSYTDDWLLDIEQGMLKIAGDVKAEIEANVAAGQITAYDGEGTVIVELIDGNTVVTAWPADPNTATNPYPRNRSRHIDPNVVCHWTTGLQATSHDVYFGTDFNDVNSATTSDSVYIENVGPNEWDPCGAGPLYKLTTYYWRIDEKNGGTFKGKVWRFTTSGPLVDPNLLVWYKFDERSPNTIAHDSSGYGNDGPIGLDDEKEVQEPTWDPDGYDGGCLVFNDDMVVQPPGTLLSNIGAGVTFSVWLKDAEEDSENWIFDAGGGQGAARHLTASVPHSGSEVYWRAGNDTNDVCVWTDANPTEWMGHWRHFAFVKDESAGNMKIYYEGELVAEQTGVSVGTLADIQVYALKIGTAAWTNFDYEGAMDEFRFYDRALSAIEIETLFRGELGPAWGPAPADGAVDVPRDVVLSWSPGKYAQNVEAHDVYFGTSFNDVNDANTTGTLGVYQGSQDLEANSYTPGVLELDTVYYWRIDEVNDNDPNIWKGNMWTFTVADYIVIDNFESYDDSDNRIYYTWVDFIGGSEIDLGIEPFSPAYRGDQSMLCIYDNRFDPWGVGYYSEVELPFDSPQDFTEVGVKVLTLYFYGDPGNDINDTERLYVGLGGSYAQVNCPDMNDLSKASWTEWNIEITDFAGVDPCAVTSLFIGFGARGSETPGGDGLVYFDDIRLYPPRCVPEFGPAADFSSDCIVDWVDVRIMAGQWLRTDANLAVSAPSPGPVGHWEFEEGGGSSVGDSSGYGNDGTAEGAYSWVDGRIGNYAMAFDGGRVLVPDAPELRPAGEITAAAWIYYSAAASYSARVVAKGADEGNRENFAMQVTSEDEFSWFVRDTNTTLHGADGEDKLAHNEWIHVAGTYDGNAVTCYINGQVSSSSTVGAITLLQDTNDLAIANRADANDRSFIGTVDDVQIYNYALSTAQVAYLVTQGTGYLALGSQVNIYDEEPAGEKAINIRDLAVLLNAWLEEKLWP